MWSIGNNLSNETSTCLSGGESGQETQRGCFNSLIGAMIIDKDEGGEEGNVIGCHKGTTAIRSHNLPQ